MRLEDVTAEIRPRSTWEAFDLGVALVRRDFWRLAGLWVVAMAPVLAAAWWLRWHPFGWLWLVWWCKPVGSRLALLDLSRSLFGERLPAWRWLRRVPWVWFDRGWRWLGVGRFSVQRPLAMAVADLEGLRGMELRDRVQVVRRRGSGAVFGLAVAGLVAQVWFGLVVFALAAMMVPEGQTERWSEAFELWLDGEAVAPPLLLGWTLASSLLPAMVAVDLFVAGAGFGLYLNNRSWIEGWDVELAFKRLAERLRKSGLAALVAAAVVFTAGGGQAWAGIDDDNRAEGQTGEAREELAGTSEPALEREVLEQVMEDDAFRVHTVKEREWVGQDHWTLPDWLRGLIPGELLAARDVAGMILFVCLLVALVVAVVWVVVRYRHLFFVRGEETKPDKVPSAGFLLGSSLAPEAVPADPPRVALEWWREGRRREALALLYRAAIVWFVEHRQLEIGPATTEEDCVRRVRGTAGDARQADHFRRLTTAWILVAYGSRGVADDEMAGLCEGWPYREEGVGS